LMPALAKAFKGANTELPPKTTKEDEAIPFKKSLLFMVLLPN